MEPHLQPSFIPFTLLNCPGWALTFDPLAQRPRCWDYKWGLPNPNGPFLPHLVLRIVCTMILIVYMRRLGHREAEELFHVLQLMTACAGLPPSGTTSQRPRPGATFLFLS